MALTFTYTVVYVADVAATVAFYRAAFGIPVRFVHDSGRYAELETGAVTLAFTQDELATTVLDRLPGGYAPNRPDQRPAGLDIALTTDDVPAAWERAVAAGAVVVTEPVAKPWGQTVGYVRDLDGVLVEIATPVDQDHPA